MPLHAAASIGKDLVHGAGAEVHGVRIQEVNLEVNKTSNVYRQRLLACLALLLAWLRSFLIF